MNPIASTPLARAPGRPFAVLLDRFHGSVLLFHERLVRPALVESLCGDAAPGELRFDGATGALASTGRFAALPVRAGSNWYAPRVTKCTAIVLGDALGVSVRGECDLGAGILLGFHVTSRLAMVLDPVTGRVVFAADPEPDVERAAAIPWWFGLGTALVASITDAVSDAVARDLPEALNRRLHR